MAAGSQFGYNLLWVISLSTLILILVQHNAAQLGIVTGVCLSEDAVDLTPIFPEKSGAHTAAGATPAASPWCYYMVWLRCAA